MKQMRGWLVIMMVLPIMFVGLSARASMFEMRVASDDPSDDMTPMRMTVTTPEGKTMVRLVYVAKTNVLDVASLESARVGSRPDGKPAILITFNPVGRERFARFTREHIGGMTAILLDDKLRETPIIQDEIRAGVCEITGDFSGREADELVREMNGAIEAYGSSIPAVGFEIRRIYEHSSDDTVEMKLYLKNEDGPFTYTYNIAKTNLLDQTSVQSAVVASGTVNGEPAVWVTFTDAGRALLAQVTRDNLNQRLAVLVDGSICFAPIVREEMKDGKLEISAFFTKPAAQDLADKINAAVKKP